LRGPRTIEKVAELTATLEEFLLRGDTGDSE